MRKNNEPLVTYFALFLSGDQPGSGEFASGRPDEPIDSLEKIKEDIRTVYLFSTSKKADELKIRNYNEKWQVMPLSIDKCQQFLQQAKQDGIYTHVSLDPGSVIIDVQPIEDFLKAIPYRTMPDD